MTVSPHWLFNPDRPSMADCPNTPHRGPQGPNEDIAQCYLCGGPDFSRRPAGETWGDHLADCSLPVDHPSYCEPGGSGHPPAPHRRGFWDAG